jgi:hypothetical protein
MASDSHDAAREHDPAVEKETSTHDNGEDDASVEADHASQDVEKPIPNADANDSDVEAEGPARESVERTSPHQLSRVSSVFSRTQSVIPRLQRRGLFGKYAIIPEIERPYEYKDKTKWAITAIVALAAGAAPVGGSIFYRKLDMSPRSRISCH